MRKQNRTFHVLRKPDICTCYEHRSADCSTGASVERRISTRLGDASTMSALDAAIKALDDLSFGHPCPPEETT